MEKRSNALFCKIIFLATLVLASCKADKMDFFPHMNPVMKDMKIDSEFYFIKDFRFKDTPENIRGRKYWDLENSESSYFKLAGYLRKENDSIMIVPHGYDNFEFKEYKLFDFGAKINASWKIIHNVKSNSSRMGDSIVLSKVRSDKRYGKIYVYTFFPFMFDKKSKLTEYYDPAFRLEVNMSNGIMSISALDSRRITERYHAILFPQQKLVQNPTHILEL